MSEKAELIANHYQNSFEVTYRMWGQRNRLFFGLIAIIAIATLLTYQPTGAQPLLVAWVSSLLNITAIEEKVKFAQSFPYALLQSIFLSIVFFMVFNLYHRTQAILRSYAYLALVEHEIRKELNIDENDVAFTRESSFYWDKRPMLLGTVKFVYVFLLGGLLVSFLVGRVKSDFQAENWWLLLMDVVIAIPVTLYYIGYAHCTIKFDYQRVVKPSTKPQAG